MGDVRAVFTHPIDPLSAWVATSDGLLKTADDGVTWKPLPAGSTEKVGPVTAVVVCPADETRVLLGTEEKGLFLSEDGGVTFKHLGSESEKPASETVAAVAFSRNDPSWRTILVTHGQTAPGVSFSRDLGKTWEVLGGDRYLGGFVQAGDTLVAAGSMVQTQGKSWGIHRSGFDGRRWEECSRNVPVGMPAVAAARWDNFYFSTLDGRILESENDGNTWQPIVQSESAQWNSLFFTHGRSDRVEILAAYDPGRRGLVLSPNRMRAGTQRGENKNLYVGAFVKSGASCRANANGTTYYVTLNNALWIARRTRTRPDGPLVTQARCLPGASWVGANALQGAGAAIARQVDQIAAGAATDASVLAIAQSSRTLDERKAGVNLTIQAKVDHPKGRSGMKVVTADLTPLGGKSDLELFDDGKHGDGAAGDGLWSVTTVVSLANLEHSPERNARWPLPGIGAVTVTAIDAGGNSDSWSAVVSIQRRPEPVGLHPIAVDYRFGSEMKENATVHQDGANAMLPGHAALCFTATNRGPWRAAEMHGGGTNIAGGDYLTFYIKGDVNQDVWVAMVDRFQSGEDVVDEPHLSKPARLISGGYLKAITNQYQEVKIPIAALLPKGTFFLTRHAAGICLGTDADGKPGKYFIDQAYVRP